MNQPIISPCRQICRIGVDNLCDGCGRSLSEVAAWLRLSDQSRRVIMDRLVAWVPRTPGA